MKLFTVTHALLGSLWWLASGIAAAVPLLRRQSAKEMGNFTQVTDFGSNPTNVSMFIYTPLSLATIPAVVVAIHFCQGSAQIYHQGTKYGRMADMLGFLVIYPSSPHDGGCWDVSSPATLTRNGGGDSNAIVNMVTYAIQTFNADPSKIFVTGSSSGAMMTNVLASAYPDMFAAASVLSGVPAGCFASSSGGIEQWNETCSEGKSIASTELWASTAENMDPGYAGKRPKIQLWHGTNDTILAPQNLVEEIKQWTGVFGVSETATNVTTDSPLKGYTTKFYGEDVVGISAEGVGHPVPVDEVAVLSWFGIY